MPKPLPWSRTALDTFKNCPFQYHAKYVLKSVKEPPSEQMEWGRIVHKHFEEYVLEGKPLPSSLLEHKDYIEELEGQPGVAFTEQRIALDTAGKPCNYFDRGVWYRGAIDYKKVDPVAGTATIVDYKTGKPHQKFEQLADYTLHTFILHPNVHQVTAEYYWTQTGQPTHRVWTRDDVPSLWAKLLPDLKQYKEAFDTDVWQTRPSGLCKQWCPVIDCVHNGKNPKNPKRRY